MVTTQHHSSPPPWLPPYRKYLISTATCIISMLTGIHSIPDFTKRLSILVGEDETEFIVPASLLAAYSNIFKVAAGDDEADDRDASNATLKIPDGEVDIFNHYLFWVYQKDTYKFPPPDEQPEGLEMVAACDQLLMHHIKLWVFADRLDDKALCNRVMDDIIYDLDHSCKFSPEMTAFVWDATTSASPLRRLVMDYYISSPGYLELHRGEFTRTFLEDVLVQSLNSTSEHGTSDPLEKCPCVYHELVGDYRPCECTAEVLHWVGQASVCRDCVSKRGPADKSEKKKRRKR